MRVGAAFTTSRRPFAGSSTATTILLLFLLLLSVAADDDGTDGRSGGRVLLDFLDDFQAIPDDDSDPVCAINSLKLRDALRHNATHRTLRIPFNRTFYLHPGISASNVNDAVLLLDGTLKFQRPRKGYGDGGGDEERKRPFAAVAATAVKERPDDPPACLFVEKSRNFTVTSNHRGLIDGQVSQYWGIPFIGYLELVEHRPRLLRFNLTSELLIENVVLQDSPYHTLYLQGVNNVEIRNVSIVARRTRRDGHSFLDLSAFNTDGIDVSGRNVHVHDVDIWNQVRARVRAGERASVICACEYVVRLVRRLLLFSFLGDAGLCAVFAGFSLTPSSRSPSLSHVSRTIASPSPTTSSSRRITRAAT